MKFDIISSWCQISCFSWFLWNNHNLSSLMKWDTRYYSLWFWIICKHPNVTLVVVDLVYFWIWSSYWSSLDKLKYACYERPISRIYVVLFLMCQHEHHIMEIIFNTHIQIKISCKFLNKLYREKLRIYFQRTVTFREQDQNMNMSWYLAKNRNILPDSW